MTDEEEIDLPQEETFDASDPKAINTARKKEKRLRQKRINFVRRMMDDEDGRLWLHDYLIMGHMAAPTHTPGDPYSTAFKEGERNLVNRMLYDITESAPEMYMKLLIEGRTEK